MPTEQEYVRARLERVEQALEAGPAALVADGSGKGHRRRPDENDTPEQAAYMLEARLLRHVLACVPEGRLAGVLPRWRREFGTKLASHRRQHKAVQDRVDAWWALPFYRRQTTPRPPAPPAARHHDQFGNEWLIDDAFLALLDDLRSRLDLWLYAPD